MNDDVNIFKFQFLYFYIDFLFKGVKYSLKLNDYNYNYLGFLNGKQKKLVMCNRILYKVG